MNSIQKTPRIAGNAATVLYSLTIILQLLLASGILPITMAWGGREPVLTTNLRIASVASAALLFFFIYVIRRRAGLVRDAPITLIIKVLSWLPGHSGFTEQRGEDSVWANFLLTARGLYFGFAFKIRAAVYCQSLRPSNIVR